MRPRLVSSLCLSACVSIALTAPASAQADGMALRWDRCFSEAGGTSVRSFACDSNAGSERLVVSLALSTDMADVAGIEVVLHVWTYGGTIGVPTGAALPAWWEFKNAGSCRQTVLGASIVADPDNAVCEPMWDPSGIGAVAAYQLEMFSPGAARLLLVTGVPASALSQLTAGTEYEAITVTIRHDKTVGTGACGGCLTPMQLFLEYVNVVPIVSANNRRLTAPLHGTGSQLVLWSPSAVATHPSTWGAVKSLYH